MVQFETGLDKLWKGRDCKLKLLAQITSSTVSTRSPSQEQGQAAQLEPQD